MENIFIYMFGLINGLVFQWISYYLFFRKNQKQEHWIRILNSYQDFDQHSTQLIELLKSGISVPDDVFWQSVLLTRKAAYDANFFDKSNPDRTNKMKTVSLTLIQIFHQDTHDTTELDELMEQINEIQTSFYEEKTKKSSPLDLLREELAKKVKSN